ncbi:ATP-binding protein [Nocardioides sp. DS6]|uniref:ATP-binding protein n=1 Tax=Nocardioides eburneus TaxID=3231482 RepID=A0ABV3SZB7_9ACTN
MSITEELHESVEDSDGLFDEESVATPSDEAEQWRADVLQLVNWGGFGGHVSVDLSSDATMMSGASGVGKSTLLDAYTALMMPSDTRFNGASNDAVAGRARSVGQRNLLSYLRGAVDVVDDPRTGRPVERLLRGKGVDTWGAVAMTFTGDRGRRFTLLRTYYVGRRASRSSDISMQLATLDADIDLAHLEIAVPERFHANALKRLYPGLRVHQTYAEFAAVLYARLGIGANGDGAKALRLLARIQAGNQVRSVDELYKDMVLERPATYAAADRAIEHFDDLEQAYTAMRVEQQKLEVLAPITELHERKLRASARAAELDAFGVTRPGDTPIRLWVLRTHARLLAAASDGNRAARRAVAAELAAGRQQEGRLQRDLEAARVAHRDAGGGALEVLAAELDAEEQVREARRGRRTSLRERTAILADLFSNSGLEAALSSAAEFERLSERAADWLADPAQEQERLHAARDRLVGRKYPLAQRSAELRREREAMERRPGRVPESLHQLRTAVAEASGLPVEELPFIAELMDVRPEETRWRTAVETVLGASARIMLVPADRLEEFSRAIDAVQLRGRLTFEGAERDLPAPDAADPDRIAGKLVVKESPYAGWVLRHVATPSRNALCVESAAELAGSGLRVTPAGQTRHGARGSHGRGDQRSIIGFSNAEAVAEIDAELAELEAALTSLDGELADHDRQLRVLEATRAAYDAITQVAFEDLDVAASTARIEALEARRDEILSADDRLATLETQIADLERQLQAAGEQRYALGAREKELNTEHGLLVDDEDQVNDELERIEAGRVVLSEEQSVRIDEEFAAAVAPGDPESLDQFHANSARLQARLTEAARHLSDEVEQVDRDLSAIFRSYLFTWEDPNLSASPEAYPDFARILGEIEATGLAQRRAEWRRRLTEWSGQDLVPLAGAMASSVEEIEDRLEPINAILRRLEFGAERDRLRIRLRKLAPAHVQLFLRDLRALSAGVPKDLTDEQLEQRFAQLSRFMNQLRRPRDAVEAGLSERDRLLDVRRHVEVSAERYDYLTGEVRATFRTLGEKSGGESQELVAFIVGSALRFRLGDELRSRPRFAPVFLDEGFVKADSEFAGRAVAAWKGLGFQLVIGVPLDKVTGLEPHMDRLLVITKNTETHLSSIVAISDADRADG